MPTALENVFYNNTSVTTGIGCTIEYNMNSLIDGIEVSTPIVDATYISGIDVTDGTVLKINPFKKLFPVDSVIKPFRPLYSGVKYFIMLPNDTPTNSFSAFRTVAYPGEGSNANQINAQPRVYYPGITNSYKYWVTPKDVAADITVTYKPDGSTTTGNKYALTNKIILRFEKNHSLPSQYKIIVTPKTGSAMDTGFISTPSSGQINLYYNGLGWTTSTPSSYHEPQEIKSIRLITSAPETGRVIGVIELSARWIKDISSDLVSFDIAKESSANTEDILPVGFITANSFICKISNYNESFSKIVEYNREISEFNSSLMYICKNAEVKPYIKVYHSLAASIVGQYDIVQQGTYYIDSWSIDSYSDTNITAIDGSKYLMESMATDILAQDYPVTAIIRQLLDSVGFTNYNFNFATTETSIPSLTYWWTDDTKTVWEHLQELCRDIQMNAVFDDDGILQFYSRDYMYSKDTTDWEFYYDKVGNKLPNIVDLNKKEIASANQVKVLWQTYLTSNYVGDSGPLWSSPTNFLSAGALLTEILENDTVEDINNKKFIIDNKISDNYSQYQSIFNFNGYLLIQSEIFEFDAIEYQYDPITNISSSPDWQTVWITSQADVSKYRYLAKPGYQDINKPETAFFKPTGRIRIKSRAALGTKEQTHTVPGATALSEWTGRTVTWQI